MPCDGARPAAFALLLMLGRSWGNMMLNQSDESSADMIEACADDLDDFIASLDRFAEPVIAIALRIHLAALLRTLVEQHVCSREDVRNFILELEQETLGVGED